MRFALASTFNLQVIQKLPPNVKNSIAKKLKLHENNKHSTILTKFNYSNRKKLAKILNDYADSSQNLSANP